MLLFLAWRSLWRRPRRTLISLASIAFGLALAIAFGSLANGLYRKSIDDATKTLAGPLTVERPEYRDDPSPGHALGSVAEISRAAEGIDGIVGLKPVAGGQVMVATAAGSAGVSLLGVDPAVEGAVSPVARHVVSGRFLQPGDDRGAVVGSALAARLHLEPGRKLVVTVTRLDGELSSDLLRVTGVFSTGAEEFDGYFVEVPIGAARRILGLSADQATQVGVLTSSHDDRTLVRVQREMSARLPQGVGVFAWRETMPGLAGWIELDRRSNEIMRAMVVGLVLFTILNTIVMSVLERGREFAVLLALGTPPGRLRAQVFFETVLLATVGCGAGLLIGVALSLYGAIHGVDLSAFMAGGKFSAAGFAVDPQIHFDLTVAHVTIVTALVFLATVAIGLWPALRATRVQIATALRTAR